MENIDSYNILMYVTEKFNRALKACSQAPKWEQFHG